MESALGGFPDLYVWFVANFPSRSQKQKQILHGHRESTVNDNDPFFRFVTRKRKEKKNPPPSVAILLVGVNCSVYDICVFPAVADHVSSICSRIDQCPRL